MNFSPETSSSWEHTLSLPLDTLEKLVEIFEGYEGPQDLELLDSQISEALQISSEDSKKILEGLLGLFSFMVFQAVAPHRLAVDLVDVLDDLTIEKEKAVSLIVRMLVSHHPVSTYAFGYAAKTGAKQRFMRASFFPEIVPIQTFDKSAPMKAAFVRFEVKVSSKEGDEYGSHYFSLDGKALRALHEEVGRALLAEAAILKQMEEINVKMMDILVD
jgi:hypothetical protein